jgi:hypothetical protein
MIHRNAKEILKCRFPVGCQWLKLIILAAWEAKIKRIAV